MLIALRAYRQPYRVREMWGERYSRNVIPTEVEESFSLAFRCRMFDEEKLQIAFNDVDLCLKLQESGYRNIFTPYCEAYHYESASRGYDECLEKLERIEKEKFNLKEKQLKNRFNSNSCYDSFPFFRSINITSSVIRRK